MGGHQCFAGRWAFLANEGIDLNRTDFLEIGYHCLLSNSGRPIVPAGTILLGYSMSKPTDQHGQRIFWLGSCPGQISKHVSLH